MDRTLHKLKPHVYDAPTGEKADPNVWTGPSSGPEFDAWVARSYEADVGATTIGVAALFVCEGGNPAIDVAFEEFPPDEVLAELRASAGGPLLICTGCYPEKAQ